MIDVCFDKAAKCKYQQKERSECANQQNKIAAYISRSTVY